jgi:endonuclease-3
MFNALNKLQALELIQLLNKSIKNPQTSLKYRNQFTLLTSVVLSAQCTDINVNNVTQSIYKKYYTPEHFVDLGVKKIKRMIKSIGLFNMKAKNLYNLSKILIEKYKSKVPNTFEDLINLPGVGRKTANVVLNAAFNKPTIAVDTHVFRVSNRTGLTKGNNPSQVEEQLLKIIPNQYLKKAHHLILLHGRYTCKSRNPLCTKCIIEKICLYKDKNV